MTFLQRIGCALIGHPKKRIEYWFVKTEPGGISFSGMFGREFGGSGDAKSATPGPPFAVITFECPDCRRRWHTELS